MGLEVKQILKSLCFSYGWSYAVFWSYDRINPMLLRFQEAYNDEKSLVVFDESHSIGQGIVGEAALTGNHQWLFSDTSVLQCEHEFQNQFLSGLKTIAIIPVGSSGVVQLGSTQKILESPEMLGQTKRAVQEMCLKRDQSVDLDTLFESLVPLGNCEIVPESSLQVLSFDDIFSYDNPPSLLRPEIIISDKASEYLTDGDDFGFDVLKSYSLDDLYQLLADSQEQTGDHQENSVVIQGNDDRDLFDALRMSSNVSSSPLGLPPKGLFSELISSSLSNNTCSSLTTTAQDYYCGVNLSKRRKVETSPSFYPEMRSEKTVTPVPRSLWIDEERSSKWSVVGNGKKPHEEGLKKKRAKVGESRKPRPKDRQMIQDRIKELRGMIPNGAKCSIDTLLDLTIKHMVFMQSVAKYADKLKEAYEPKLVKEKERTWAMEVGEDESVVCPIIVEELKPQGQMLIEIMCEEIGEFLEIADVMRGGLGLTILRGVMETRQDQIWAHFIVETKPHITRLQVLCTLVQLFQQHKMDPISLLATKHDL